MIRRRPGRAVCRLILIFAVSMAPAAAATLAFDGTDLTPEQVAASRELLDTALALLPASWRNAL
ncbi:MAG: hypothetical protein SXG53_27280, partial [Pseudomonadota bacterium]|nr:hypothetical protein [Pseudomonadota bacterium]